ARHQAAVRAAFVLAADQGGVAGDCTEALRADGAPVDAGRRAGRAHGATGVDRVVEHAGARTDVVAGVAGRREALLCVGAAAGGGRRERRAGRARAPVSPLAGRAAEGAGGAVAGRGAARSRRARRARRAARGDAGVGDAAPRADVVPGGARAHDAGRAGTGGRADVAGGT